MRALLVPGPGRAGCSVGAGPGSSQGWPWENDICVGRASLPEDRAALLAQREVRMLKAFQLFSFYCGILFFCSAMLVALNVELLPKIK